MKVCCNYFFYSRFLFTVSLLGFFLAVVPTTAYSQNQQNTRLFDASGTVAANARLAEKSAHTSRGLRSAKPLNFRDDLVEDLRFDDLDTLLVTTTSTNDSSLVRGVSYLSYLETVQRVTGFDDDDARDTAGRLSIYQGARTVSTFVLHSNFSDDYQRLVSTLREIQETLSLRISKDQTLRAGSNGSSSFSKSNRLLELRLHASPQNGLEPRLLIGERTILRYSPLDGEALVAYEFNF